MLICPKCKEVLEIVDKTYKCKNNHSYDIASSGYVNLLLSKTNAGDNKEMVNARASLLATNIYLPLALKLKEIINSLNINHPSLLDVGCGVGYYANLLSYSYPSIIGFDISTHAINKAAKNYKHIPFFVSSISSIPMSSGSCDVLYHVFSPVNAAEEARVLKKDGILIVVGPGKQHLLELKEKIYSNVYLNEEKEVSYPGFTHLKDEYLLYNKKIESVDLFNLLKMTPYFYKTNKADFASLDDIEEMDITINFKISIYVCK